mmetsp:Transcript_68272/g.177708  ORF Transcript_68272/g.177708 Transcript_68272/m.177708 type:complete len:268 (-) Transcript_68272:286-1089(-)
MHPQGQFSVGLFEVLFVAGTAGFYLQDVELVPRVEDPLGLVEPLGARPVQQALVDDAVGRLHALALRAGAEVAGADEQRLRGPVLEEQHRLHLSNPAHDKPLTQQQGDHSVAGRERVWTLQQLGVELPQHLLQRILQLARLPRVDLGREGRYELGVEVLRAPVGRLRTAQPLEKREGGRGSVHEAQRELQRQPGDLGQLVQQHRPLHLGASAHGACAGRAGHDGEVRAGVRRVDLPEAALADGVLHEVLPHPRAQLREVHPAARVPE